MMNKKKKLLMISYYYPPVGGIGLPGCMRVLKFIRYLDEWDISVLTIHPDKYPSYFNTDNMVSLPIKNEKIYYTSITDVFKFIIDIRKGIFGNKKTADAGMPRASDKKPVHSGKDRASENIIDKMKHVPKKIKDIIHDACYFPDHASPWIPNAIVTGIKIIKKEKPDVLFATGMPWSALIIANALHKYTGIPYVCDFRDPWVDNPFHSSKGSMFDKMNKHFEREVVNKSALVTVNTIPLKHQMMQRYPHLSEDKFVVLPNGYDPSHFDFVAENHQRGANAEKFHLAHAGFLYGERNPIPILKAISDICRKYRYPSGEIEFLQIGSMEDDIKSEMDRYMEEGIAKCLGQLPHDSCMKTLRESDVLVIIQQGTETQIPSKIFEYICLNRPILTITKRGGALWTLLEEYKFGVLFEPDDIDRIAEKIHEYYIRKKSVGCLEEEYPLKTLFDIRQISKDLSDHMMKIAGSDRRKP